MRARGPVEAELIWRKWAGDVVPMPIRLLAASTNKALVSTDMSPDWLMFRRVVPLVSMLMPKLSFVPRLATPPKELPPFTKAEPPPPVTVREHAKLPDASTLQPVEPLPPLISTAPVESMLRTLAVVL